MLPFRSRHGPVPRADLHRRRIPRKRVRRLSWLRLSFWLRKNHRTKPRSVAGVDVEAAQAVPLTEVDPGSGKTVPTGSSGPVPPGRRWPGLGVVLRVLLALVLTGCLGGLGYGLRYLLHHSRSFAVRAVRVNATVHTTQEALVQRARVEVGQNLFQVDLQRVQRSVSAEPWVKSARVRRELPGTVIIDVVEREARALVSLGALYLVDEQGQVFKRATAAEAEGLPVVTGIDREVYLGDPQEAQEQVHEALQGLLSFRGAAESPRGGTPPLPDRPPIGEVHVESNGEVTLYTDKGVAIRLGHGDAAETRERLRRFDAVWAALQRGGARPAMVFLNSRAHPDHITVRLDKQP